ncbi:MAG: methyltransferase domain-containing protein [Nitrospirae bacterium]|nr:methyltransferase domain-containing protein [Nitrospirota bacterium]
MNANKTVAGETVEKYEKKKKHYQSDTVASKYDDVRFIKRSHRMRNNRKLAAIQKAISTARDLGHEIKNVLDIPCGTGRLFPLLIDNKISFTGSDISREMMEVSRTRFNKSGLINGMVRCDAESLPFRDRSFDSVLSIRFMFHVPKEVRHNILIEMARISRKWLIIDFRHKYTVKYYIKSFLSNLGIGRPPSYRFSESELQSELHSAGIKVVRIFPTLRFFSDKWVVLCKIS